MSFKILITLDTIIRILSSYISILCLGLMYIISWKLAEMLSMLCSLTISCSTKYLFFFRCLECLIDFMLLNSNRCSYPLMSTSSHRLRPNLLLLTSLLHNFSQCILKLYLITQQIIVSFISLEFFAALLDRHIRWLTTCRRYFNLEWKRSPCTSECPWNRRLSIFLKSLLFCVLIW